MQICEMLKSMVNDLADAGITEADNEARVILREIAGIDRGYLFAHPDRELEPETVACIEDCIKRRLMREPLQYILGNWDFMGLNFFVNSDVLIPRPDTEILVECALKELHDGMRILDMCTGTGCIILSLLHYSNMCTGTAVDISDKALDVTKRNAEKILEEDYSDSLEILKSNLFENVDGTYDIIVSNPPYINSGVIDTLEPEVRDFEPHLALDGGTDGLDLVRNIIRDAMAHLCKGGSLIMEIGHDQGQRVSELAKMAGYVEVTCIQDYAGNDRVVMGKRPIL